MKYFDDFEILPFFAVKNSCEVKELFNLNRKKLEVEYDFEYLVKNTHLFLMYKNSVLGGGIYYFHDKRLENKVFTQFELKKGGGGSLLFMNGFSKRKMLNENIRTVCETAKFYNEDIYSYTKQRPAVYVLLKAGFRKIHEKEESDLNDYGLFKLSNKKCK